MQTPQDTQKWDAIVIGSGLGGMAVATFLSMAKKRVLLLLLVASCAHPDPVKGEFWLCHARSENDESRSHREGHWATCQGVQYCAREEALKRCLWHHPADCVITKCQQIPELKGEPAAPEIKSVDEELRDLEPKS